MFRFVCRFQIKQLNSPFLSCLPRFQGESKAQFYSNITLVFYKGSYCFLG